MLSLWTQPSFSVVMVWWSSCCCVLGIKAITKPSASCPTHTFHHSNPISYNPRLLPCVWIISAWLPTAPSEFYNFLFHRKEVRHMVIQRDALQVQSMTWNLTICCTKHTGQEVIWLDIRVKKKKRLICAETTGRNHKLHFTVFIYLF